MWDIREIWSNSCTEYRREYSANPMSVRRGEWIPPKCAKKRAEDRAFILLHF